MKTEQFKVFGWRMQRHTLEKGERFEAKYPEAVPAERLPNWTFWTKGGFDVVQAPEDAKGAYDRNGTRHAGYCGKRAMKGKTLAAGTYTYVANEDSEFWCLNSHVNRGQKPTLIEHVVIPAGGSQKVKQGQNLLIARGDTSLGVGPKPIQVTSKSLTLTATTDTYLIVLSKRTPKEAP